ncbi:uncharacterized protein LOC127726032 [Mytilus californianus]|uniref:uncharacterized protein LOC127726032 n=1 Tax=Mytilus californianus TaxID=6549 RepID=UPI002245D8E0|nr:uncharacterized protein LOC127726032 [Mytilus californianus]XP_052089291.1 uncharacterized protein LOC127726032 [Mytilus californianus]
MDNKSKESESSATQNLKTDQQLDSEQNQKSNKETLDKEIDLKSNTLEQDTVNIERLPIANVGNYDSKPSYGFSETEQINEIQIENYPGPDPESRTTLEGTAIETLKTSEKLDLAINKIPKTPSLQTMITLEATDPETRITPVTSDATHQETGVRSEAENLDTMIKLEATDLDKRKQPETTNLETRETPETTDQMERRPTTDISDDEKSTSNMDEPTSPNSTILIDNPVSGSSFAWEMKQFDSPKTTDRQEENQPYSSPVILSPETAGNCNVLTRRHIPRNEGQESPINTLIAEENDEWKKKPHFERRRMFNLTKHIISIVLIILDLVFDWVEYSEMNKRGNYTLVAERRVKDVEFTIECEGSGKTVQFVFLVFTIVATILSMVQILHIIYQMFHETKGVVIDKKIIHEYVETFVFLFFIEISQIMLIMGFYDVCTLDCTVDATEILLVLNGLFSISKVSWRFFTSCKCCTVYWKNPIRQSSVKRHSIRTESPRHIGRRENPPLYRHPATQTNISNSPSQTQRDTDCCRSCECSENTKTCFMIIFLPFLVLLIPILPCILVYYIAKKFDCDCDVCDSKVGDPERAQNKWKCERSCKCCILRCFPSRFPERDTEACDCTCKQCLSCEKFCKCCIVRCFPTKLSIPKDDVFECKCGDCMSCERNCRCCLVRCCPTHLVPPKSDVFTCRCGDCIAFERPCKCFTFRCCPTHLNPPKNDIWNCSCRECLACTMPYCQCFIFRCFPEFLKPSHPDICTCRCGECLSCDLPCKCFSFRCFPEHQKPPKSDWFECTCGDCMNCERNCCCCILRCFPSYADEDDFCTCILRKCLACQKSFACCLCRCFPSELDPPKIEIFKCTCGKCLSCEKKCCCCIMRCCPSDLRSPEDDWFECTCCKNCVTSQVHPPPMILQPHQQTPQAQRISTPPLRIPIPQQKCTCGKCLSCEENCCCCIRQPRLLTPPTRRISIPPSHPPPISVITTQPIPQPRPVVIPQATPIIIPQVPMLPPPKQRKQLCGNCNIKCINFLVAVFILLVIVLLLFYLFLLVVEIQFVFVCVEGEWLMLATQEIFVQNYLKLFNV